MNHRKMDRLRQVDADRILQDLTTRQHLHPHRALAEVLDDAAQGLGYCPGAVEAAIGWLQIDATLAIGRFRRAELIQLSRSIHRFWRQALSGETAQPQWG